MGNLRNQEFMTLPVSIIEELETNEMLLLKGGNANDQDSVENSGTGCHCGTKNTGTGCHC